MCMLQAVPMYVCVVKKIHLFVVYNVLDISLLARAVKTSYVERTIEPYNYV